MSCLLTISIPTWNRCAYLRENVVSIVNVFQQMPPGSVELFISDNHSDDETPVFLQALAQEHAFVRTHRQASNVGANANFYTVLREAKGDYVWLLGDDDAIVPASLQRILDDLQRYSPSMVIGGIENDTTHQRLTLPQITTHRHTDQSILAEYDLIALAGKMSVLIFKTAALKTVLEDGWKLIVQSKTPWPHLIWFLQLLARQHSLLILPYATNYFIEKNRYNLLQSGTVLLTLHVLDYAQVLSLVSPEFTDVMNHHLIKRLVVGRMPSLIKMLAYATFLNTDEETRRTAVCALKTVPTLQNKWRFALGYVLPSLLPQRVRHALFCLPLCFVGHNSAYRKFIDYLRQARVLSAVVDGRQVFNKADL